MAKGGAKKKAPPAKAVDDILVFYAGSEELLKSRNVLAVLGLDVLQDLIRHVVVCHAL